MKWINLLPLDAITKMKTLSERANKERMKGKIICPSQENIFRALQLTPPDKVKVCIIGQDPYHSSIDTANGLAFSITPGHSLQPSVRNIFKEYRDDLGFPQPSSGDLTPWAERGVLLLNTSLTVEAGKANSHADWGWQDFTGEIVRICSQLPQPIVFLAWGRNAQDLVHKYIPNGDWKWTMKELNKVCLESSHPSPFSASRSSERTPAFLGSKPFSSANKCLEMMGADTVDWRLK